MNMVGVGSLILSQLLTWSELEPRIANVTSSSLYQRVSVGPWMEQTLVLSIFIRLGFFVLFFFCLREGSSKGEKAFKLCEFWGRMRKMQSLY